MGQTDWIPGLFALAFGVAVGLVLLLRSRAASARAAPAATPRPQVPNAMLAERDALLARLHELDVEPETEASSKERYDTELKAARLLRDIDRVAAAAPKAPAAGRGPAAAQGATTAPPAPPRNPSSLRSTLIGAWAGATVVLLVMLVRDAAKPRDETQQGPMAGPPMGQAAAPPMNAAPAVTGTLSLGPGVKVQPNSTLFIVARADGERRGPPVAAARGVVSEFPVAFEMGDESSMMGAPFPEKATLEARIDFDGDPMTRDANEPSATVDGVVRGTSGLNLELKVGGSVVRAPPGAGAAVARASAGAAEASGGTIEGLVSLEGSAGGLPAGATLFVFARTDGERRGPPIAAKKLDASQLPAAFAIGQGDSMMGLPLPDQATIEARVDFDGNPMTRDPEEPTALASGVKLGTRDLKLVLKKRSLMQQ